MKTITFNKMHANGNDFLITDDREILNQPIQKLSNRKTGVGFDQLLFFDKEIQSVQIFNADGSKAKSCFNGLRCVAKLYDLNNFQLELFGRSLILNSDGSVQSKHPAILHDDTFAYLDIGNKHVVVHVKDIHNTNLVVLYDKYQEYVKTLKLDIDFNLNVYEEVNNYYQIRTFENGVGETLSCGTGTSATAFMIYKQLDKKTIKFLSKGGETTINISNDYLISKAKAKISFQGELSGG